ncbi:MAG: glycosyltransferase family 4 protein [Patescibacteria group bacterium]
MFSILFWGKMIPLQGVQYIRTAAELLKDQGDIEVRIIGDPPISYQELMNIIPTADVCLGIFGDTDKAQRVIPNKVYEAIAAGKPVISGDTTAIRELFTDRENILLCNVADPKDLAAKIIELKEDRQLRENIAKNAHALYQKKLRPEQVVRPLISYLNE